MSESKNNYHLSKYKNLIKNDKYKEWYDNGQIGLKIVYYKKLYDNGQSYTQTIYENNSEYKEGKKIT